MRHELETIYDPDQRRRVVKFRRGDDSYGFEEQRFGEEGAWLPAGRCSESICDTAERAESEARSRVAWLNVTDQLSAYQSI